jgi:hypothetical protein
MIQNDPHSRPKMSVVVDELTSTIGYEHVSPVKRQRDLENEQDTSSKGKKLRLDKLN